jgi:hypothetical protein
VQPRAPRVSGATALLALFPLFTAACFATSGASSNAIPLVRAHAETDLDCPGDQIRITQQFGGRFEAIGCGHKAVYNTACEGLRCTVAEPGKNIPWRDRPDPVMNP